jgi:3-oxoacyl-[acyl-carrier protein] reductase
MQMNVENRVAAITGGGGAIGRASAKMLAAEGALVALLDLSQEAMEDAKAEIERDVPGAKVFTHILDVTQVSSVESAFQATKDALGPTDILVNNAGFSRDKYMTRMAMEDWQIVQDVVLTGAFNCCRAVLPDMMDRKWGRIINMSSMAKEGNKGQTNYSAAKAGLVGMTNALAREAGPFNITANAIAPGLVATPRLRARPDFDKLEARSKSLTPLPRLADEYDVARIVLFFASSLADFITAQCMHVSGGR